jgi:putative toxin-antitoxin system antitoxin component (TIGR02293 family)
MAEVTRTGLDLFGDIGKFRLWLETPNFALGKRKPADLLMDSYGKELVLGVLTRVQHGIFI